MEPTDNTPMDNNPWLEAAEDAPLPESVTKAVNIARWAWKGLLEQGNAALQRVAQIQVPLLEDEAPMDTHTQNAWQDVAEILTSLGAVLAEGIEAGLEATGDEPVTYAQWREKNINMHNIGYDEYIRDPIAWEARYGD